MSSYPYGPYKDQPVDPGEREEELHSFEFGDYTNVPDEDDDCKPPYRTHSYNGWVKLDKTKRGGRG